MAGRSPLPRVVLIGLLALVAGSSAVAHALVAPPILYQEGVSDETLGPTWLPLDGAHVNGLGFILGTTAQSNPPPDDEVFYQPTMLAVPDGHPDQPSPLNGGCASRALAAGTDFELGIGRFEGPGTYTIQLSANLPSLGATFSSCGGGPASTATFTIDPTVTLKPTVHGRLKVAPGSDATIATMPDLPLGSGGETQCARNAKVQADGSVTGANLTKLVLGDADVLLGDLSQAGRWTCVGRAYDTGSPGADGIHFTRWSAPITFNAVAAFSSQIHINHRLPPRFTLTVADMPAGSQGGTVTVRIASARSCPHVATKTLRARVGSALSARFTFTLPEKDRSNITTAPKGVDTYGWNFTFAFSGTALVLPSQLTVGAFVSPPRFRPHDGLGFPGVNRAYCTHSA